MDKKFKIAFIGAGSIGFTRGLLSDLLAVPEFRNIEVAFMDINPRNLDMVYQLCQRDIEANGLNIKIQATLDRREALKDAKYVIDCARIGLLDAFELDVNIPLKYGVDQCVGDTLCAGGIMYAQRDIAMLEGMCRDIREVAAPGCMLLNYTNPNAMVTWYCNKYGGVPTVGLCHGVQGGHALIARALGYKQEEIDIVCAGINHMTWYLSVKHKGEELNGKLLAALEQLLAPLRDIDLEPARWAFERLRECLETLAAAVGTAFTQLWNSLLVPLLTWLARLEDDQVFPTSVSVILPISIVSLFLSPSTGLSFQTILPYLLGSIAGGILCGFLGRKIPVKWLHRGLGILMIWGGIRYLC